MFLVNNIEMPIAKGLLFSVIAIAIVFIVLVIIILSVSVLSKFKFKEEVKETAPMPVATGVKKLTIEDIKDEDMMVAALIATAEFVEETKEKDARLVSIKQIG